MPPAGRDQMRDERVDPVHHTLHIDRPQPPPFRRIDFPTGPAGRYTRVVDDEVNPAEFVQRPLRQPPDLVQIGDIGGYREGRLADFRGDPLERLRVDIGEDHAQAPACQGGGQCLPDPVRGAGDDRDLPGFQLHGPTFRYGCRLPECPRRGQTGTRPILDDEAG